MCKHTAPCASTSSARSCCSHFCGEQLSCHNSRMHGERRAIQTARGPLRTPLITLCTLAMDTLQATRTTPKVHLGFPDATPSLALTKLTAEGLLSDRTTQDPCAR
jgi:hypothetical protein